MLGIDRMLGEYVRAKVLSVVNLFFNTFDAQIAGVLVPALMTAGEAILAQVLPAITSLVPALGAAGTAGAGAGVAIWTAFLPVTVVIAAAAAALLNLYGLAKTFEKLTGFDAWAKSLELVKKLLAEITGDPSEADRSRKVESDVARINVGLIKNRKDRADAERDVALKSLEDELLDYKEQGATEDQIHQLRLAKQAEIYANHQQELTAIATDATSARYDALEALAELRDDPEAGRLARRMREEGKALSDLQSLFDQGIIKTQEDLFQQQLLALASIRRKYGEEEIAEHRKQEDEKYRKVQERLNDEREALEDKRDAEAEQHVARMRNLEEEERLQRRKLELIDREIDKIKQRYDAEREQFNDEDRKKFRSALAGVNLAPGELTYEAIETQRQAAENRFILEDISQEEYLEMLSQAALKKAALAEKELRDDQVTYQEKTRIQQFLAEAYRAYQESQLELIAMREEGELEVQEQEKETAQAALDSLLQQKSDTQFILSGIEQHYKGLFEEIQKDYKKNEEEWEISLKAIDDKTSLHVQSITQKWQPLVDKINEAVAAAQRLASLNSSGGSGLSSVIGKPSWYNPFTGRFEALGAATGGLLKGGTPGKDSIPVMAQDGELIVDNSLTRGLAEMVASFRSLTAGVGSFGPLLAGAGGSQQTINVEIHHPVVQEKQDIRKLAHEVGREIMKQG